MNGMRFHASMSLLIGLWCGFFLFSEAQSASAQDWLGWRGGTQQGRLASNKLPTQWSPTRNVRWVTAIKGRGHSSPVVVDNRVYLTTAYASEVKHLWHTVTEGLILLTALLTALLAVAFLVRVSGTEAEKNKPLVLLLLTGFALTITLLFLLLFFSPKLFNLERCNIRTWLVSSTFVSLCLMSACFGLPTASRTRILLGGIALGFAAWVALAVPSKEHAYSGGLFGPATTVLLFTSAIPLALGLYQIGRFLTARRQICRNEQIRGRLDLHHYERIAPIVIGAVVLVLALAAVLHAGVFSSTLRSEPRLIASVELPTLVRGKIVLLFAVSTSLCLLLIRVLSPNRFLTLLTVFCAVGFIITSGIKLIELVARRSPYLIYHIDQPALETAMPPPVVWCFMGLCLGCLLLNVYLCRKAAPQKASSLPAAFRVLILLLGALTFLYANYMATAQVFVRAVLCFDAASGNVQWAREALPEPQGQLDRHNTPATPTPAIMNKRLYAYFGSAGLLCLDLQGNIQWTRRDLPFVGDYGSAASPIAANGRVFVVSDINMGTSHIWAMDETTGKTLWKYEWAVEGGMGSGNNRTPEIKTLGGRETLIVWGRNWLAAFDTSTGQKLWRQALALSPYDVVASSISDEVCIYLSSGSESHAYRLNTSQKERCSLAWKNRDTGLNCVSPILIKGLLFLMEDGGLLSCIEAQSGKTLWQEELEGQFFASLVASEQALYVTNNEGVTTVVACERKFRKIAENRLDEGVYASFAGHGDNLLIRTEQHLYCIGQQEKENQ